MAAAASRVTLNVPTRLTWMTLAKSWRLCGPSRPSTRAAIGMPAAFTSPWMLAERLARRGNRRRHVRLAGDVGPDETRPIAVPRGPGRAADGVEVEDHRPPAGRHDHVHGGASEAGRAARYQHGPVAEEHSKDSMHAASFVRRGVGVRSGGYRKTQEADMSLRIGDVAPDFEADTTEGRIKFHDWIGSSWAVIFSHPKDFTPVCTTELGYMAKLKPEFDKRNTKVIGLSVDPVDRHSSWANDIKETQGHAPNFPMIGDPDLSVSKAYGMLPAESGTTSEGRTAMDNMTVRTVYVIGPDKKIKLMISYPMTTGRNFDEVLRVLDSLQLTAKHRVATPVNWKHGDDVIIAGSVSDDEAKKIYPDGWKAPKPYIRIVPQPGA